MDLLTAPDLDARLARAMTLHRGEGLVLDLTGVRFMDCAGLGPVLRARNRLADRFWLRGVRPRVQFLLDITELTQTLRILPHGVLWPADADPQRCHVVFDDLLDHRRLTPWPAPR
jgi:anti-anti-sigma factor